MHPLNVGGLIGFDHKNNEAVLIESPGLPLAVQPGHPVDSYHALLSKVAALHYHNPRFKLLFRGQKRDYKSIGGGNESTHSNLYPSLLRGEKGKVHRDLLKHRFKKLKQAEDALKIASPIQAIFTNQIVRWAILQHYDVCPTPLLDVSYSLQSALSFATDGKNRNGYLYVFAVPQVTGPISVSVESLTQVIDLTQLCPPTALRPHFQSAVLIGDYPTIADIEAVRGGKAWIGNNFSCRLLTKFHLRSLGRWTAEGFRRTPNSLLFPNDKDSWYLPTQQIKQNM